VNAVSRSSSAPSTAARDRPGSVGLRVECPGAAVRAHPDPGHRLDAAREHQVFPAGADLLRGQVHRLEPGCAEAVDLQSGHGVGQAGGERGGLGDVGALLADRGDDAEHDVVDGGRVEAWGAPAKLVDQAGDQRDRLGAVQRPGLLPPPRGVRTAS
jgi:hypothetical protein